MRRMRVLSSALGLLALGAGCATSTGGGSSQYSTMSVTRMSREQQVAWRDSTYAQAIADMEGPGATIRAEFSSFAGSRRVRGIFELDADAYVVIGHIDAEGVLRIAFPLDPRSDDGFVKGHKTYQTHEFFAGFNDSYRFRAQQGFMRTSGMSRYDSYDGGLGYLFIIASWRPMRFDRFQSEGSWDSFELADYEMMKDPRAAIYELASLLVGENREAYTVKLARYSNTQSLYGNAYQTSDYGMFRYCAGYRPLGFAFNPSIGAGMSFESPYADYYGYGYGYGQTFSRRGTTYYYDRFGDCYRTGVQGFPAYGNGYGYRIATGPFDNGGGQNTPKRAFNPEGHRTPLTPRLTPGNPAISHVADRTTENGKLPASPTYRQRGLITPDDPTTMPARRDPRIADGSGIERRSRPSIQEMVNRQPAGNAGGSRASAPRPSNNNWSRANTSDNSPGRTPSSYQPADRSPSSSSGSPPSYTPTTSVSTSPPPASSSSGQSSGPPGSSSSGRPPGGTP